MILMGPDDIISVLEIFKQKLEKNVKIYVRSHCCYGMIILIQTLALPDTKKPKINVDTM